ncbi:hypothetical protein [Streptomyces sp. LN699]|uniref:hypothetical protein n=1 Tax=Streptomyces sp. LN699 TaxID=3112981 RepID=UPI00372101FA
MSVAAPAAPAPETRTGTLDQPGGYGWPLIERLTERIDVRSHGGGKTVSAELRPT